MILAQVSDPHITLPGALIGGGYDPEQALEAVLSRLSKLRPLPDLVFFTGDLTENGLSAEYDNFKRLVAGFPCSMAAIPGNHDRRDAFFNTLRGTEVQIGANSADLGLEVSGFPLGVIGLDTLGLEGDPGGELDDSRLDWLSRRLINQDERPCLIFMHHPPFLTGLGNIDRWGLARPEPLARIVAAHPNILRVCAGHVHRAVEKRWAGTVVGVCPSVAWQLPLLDDQKAGMVPQAPAFQLHRWSEDLGLITYTEFVTDPHDSSRFAQGARYP